VSAHSPSPPPIGEWKANYLRLISFPVEPAYGIQQQWWQSLTGESAPSVADQRQKRRRVESGSYEGRELLLEIEEGKVVLTASPSVDPEAVPEGIPLLGSLVDHKPWFVSLCLKWLASCPSLSRLAFVASLHQPTPTREEAYQRLDRYLRCVEVDAASSDSFMYRINRPTASAVAPGIAVNRLSTWVSMKLTSAVGLVSNLGQPLPPKTVSEWNSCCVELDINTVPQITGSPLPTDRLCPLFQELADMGQAIAEKGDFRP